MNTLKKMSSITTTAKAALAALVALACAGSQAAVRVGDSSAEGVAAGTTPELMLFIWDPVKEVSYTKDLGVSVYGENYAAGNTATNLFVYGQQDAGYQKLFDPLNTDPKFQTFLSQSTDMANQIWAVMAVSSDPNAAFAGARSLYTTLRHDTASGTTNPEYTRLVDFTQEEFGNAEGGLETTFAIASSLCSGASCSTDFAANLSTYAVKGQLSYAGDSFRTDGGIIGSTLAPSVFNKINRSSWFYGVTMPSDDGGEPVAVDEFDNLSHDAYWGLGKDANGDYILSFTMQAHQAQPQTVQGQLLRLRTDFAAHYGTTRLISVPGDGLANVSPVPEPATWGLMGLGLALVAARARRQRG
jgi:hypothetical protein